MKRKMFLIVISVLVLCLTCGMLFVACNDKNEGNDNPDDDHNTTTGSAFDDVDAAMYYADAWKMSSLTPPARKNSTSVSTSLPPTMLPNPCSVSPSRLSAERSTSTAL